MSTEERLFDPGAVVRLSGQAAPAASSGTVSTPDGPVTWTRTPDGTLNATGGGQQLTMTAVTGPDGDFRHQAVYLQVGQQPYLTIATVIDQVQRAVSLAITGGRSQLILAITGIDASVSSGTATASGSWAGSPVSWTGPVDLTTDPRPGSPVPGWPLEAFASELSMAAFFAPLAQIFSGLTTSAPPLGVATGIAAHGDLHAESWRGSLAKAAGWAIAGGLTGGPGGAIAGAAASLWGDLVDSWDNQPEAGWADGSGIPDPNPETTSDPPVKIVGQDGPAPPPVGQDPGSGTQDPGAGGDLGGGSYVFGSGGGGIRDTGDDGGGLKKD